MLATSHFFKSFSQLGLEGLTSWKKFWKLLKFTFKQNIRQDTNAKEAKKGLKI